MTGTLIGLGLGPGAQDLLTLRAQDALKAARVVAHMHATGKSGLALDIARAHLRADVHVIAISVAMNATVDERRAAYDAACPAIAGHLDQGQDVVFVCEGDALFYGSFQYVMERLGERYAVTVVPGVTSVSASCAAAGLALTQGDDVLRVLPATLANARLANELSGDGPCVLMKIGRHAARVKTLLARLGRLDKAVLVEKATWDDERVTPFKNASDDVPYFAQVLVPARAPVAIRAPEGAHIVCLNDAGLETAKALKAALPGATLLARQGRVDAVRVDRLFDDATQTLQELFKAGTPIVAIMAAGIVVRALAPLLADKRQEPPVVAAASDGASAVPLLGGHHGANRLAQACAHATGGHAAITTASDSALGFAPDEPPHGWHVANPAAAKAVAAKALAGSALGVTVESGDARWLGNIQAGRDIVVTHKAALADDGALVLNPPTLALGVGCARGCAPDELQALVMDTLDQARLSPKSIACVASIDVKADEKAVLALADTLGVPARFFTADELNAEAPRLENPSAVVLAEVGCPGVSEGAALAAVGASGALIVPKHKTANATCAVALSPTDIDAARVGRGRGRLFIVGIGPGQAGWRTPAVTRILSNVTDVVGYGLYLDLVEDLIRGKTRHTSDLAQEEARVRQSLELAAEGRDVALVSSGDVGIYAMAALAFELLEREDKPEWNRLYIQVEPGISAFQAAASRIGAPVGHDFCLISLSDLLTPWDVIERRLKAAAQGGFVVSFYNPVSKRRRTQLERARDILLTHRAPDTPVALARELGRPGETIRFTTLGALTSDDADMLTLVMVGGEDTRRIERGQNTWVYTPRGYGAKMVGPSGSQGGSL